jgi:bifunctional ADP-heptose synthase (sugar kinase/adenylyltransferase)
MDTRSKILSPADAASLPGPLAVATGYFDVLRAAHIRELAELRRRTSPAKLLAVVLPAPGEYLPQRARGEMVAALRVIDYVVIADDAAAGRLADFLKPVEIVRLEAADSRRARELKEHVHRRQIR